ncbi:hypothetical protein HYV49_00735 [Candidatus Pacearchaeota archaeon]|nr:hypothetical protein [Candidatus Pacearchaeota archaeon]
MTKNILTIDEAIDEIKERHDKAEQKPLLVGVFGAVHSGKSYFCLKQCRRLEDPGKRWGGVYSTKDYFFCTILDEVYSKLEYLFYEIIPMNGIIPHEKDKFMWNMNIKPYTGRPLDVSAAIFNPNHHKADLDYLTQTFDIVISNPDSKKKGRIE